MNLKYKISKKKWRKRRFTSSNYRLCSLFTKCSEKKKICLGHLKKAVRLQAQQFCVSALSRRESQVCSSKASMWWPGRLRLHKSCHLSDIFKQQLSETHTAAKKKREEKVHLKEKDFNVFNTHYCPRSASVRPPSSPICHSQRAYDAAIWKTEIIWGEGRRHSEGGWSWGVRTGGSERKREVEGFKKKCRALSVDSSRILLNSQLPVLKLRLRRGSNLYSPVKR